MGMMQTYRRHSRRVTATRRWQVLRMALLERDGWRCRACETRKGRLEVDHIEPVRLAPEKSFDPANLQTLCSRCHSKKTREEVGWPAVHESPAHDAWAKAVAELATPIEQKETKHA